MIHQTTQGGKFKRLVRKLRPLLTDCPVAVETVAVGLLERLWHATIVGAMRGDIGRFDNEELAEAMGWHGDAQIWCVQVLKYYTDGAAEAVIDVKDF